MRKRRKNAKRESAKALRSERDALNMQLTGARQDAQVWRQRAALNEAKFKGALALAAAQAHPPKDEGDFTPRFRNLVMEYSPALGGG